MHLFDHLDNEILLQFKISVLYFNIYLKCQLFLWGKSWIFSSHCSSLQKSFLYAELVLKKLIFFWKYWYFL